MMRVGVHWPDVGRRYPDGTPFVELVYLEGVAPDDPHHLSHAMPRIEALAARHPGSEVLLRVDWRKGQAYAGTDAERGTYRAALGELGRLGYLGGRLILQPGNEPQLEGARGPARGWRAFRWRRSIPADWAPGPGSRRKVRLGRISTMRCWMRGSASRGRPTC